MPEIHPWDLWFYKISHKLYPQKRNREVGRYGDNLLTFGIQNYPGYHDHSPHLLQLRIHPQSFVLFQVTLCPPCGIDNTHTRYNDQHANKSLWNCIFFHLKLSGRKVTKFWFYFKSKYVGENFRKGKDGYNPCVLTKLGTAWKEYKLVSQPAPDQNHPKKTLVPHYHYNYQMRTSASYAKDIFPSAGGLELKSLGTSRRHHTIWSVKTCREIIVQGHCHCTFHPFLIWVMKQE